MHMSNVFMSYLAVGVAKSQCSSLSDGESFEGYGENEYSNRLCEVEGGGGSSSSSQGNGNGNNSGNNNNANSNGNNNNNSVHIHSGHSNDGNNNLNDTAGIELELAPHVVSSSPKK